MFPFRRFRSAKKITNRRSAGLHCQAKIGIEQLEGRFVPSTLIGVSNHRDLVFDPLRSQLDIIGGGNVWQFSTQAQQISGSIGVATGTLDGADITSDGKYLYVTDPAAYGTQGQVHRIDLNSHAIINSTYTRTANENGTWDIALGANGKGLLDTTYTSPNMVPLKQINVSTGVITTRTDDPGAGGAGKIRAGRFSRG